jgi:hypothetical protein
MASSEAVAPVVLRLPIPRGGSARHTRTLPGAFESLLLHSVAVKRLSVDVESAISALSDSPMLKYDQFLSIVDGLDSSLRAMLTATVFSQLPRDEHGAVPAVAIARYLRQRMALRGVYVKMNAYDADHDGCLSEQELENLIFDSIPHVADLAVRRDARCTVHSMSFQMDFPSLVVV